MGNNSSQYNNDPLRIVYVVRPSYVPYKESCNSAVFVTTSRTKANKMLEYLNSLDSNNNDIIHNIHDKAKDIIQSTYIKMPSDPKFKINMYTPNVFKSNLFDPRVTYYDFLLVEGHINQRAIKITSSRINDTIFDDSNLQHFRNHFNDKYIV